MIVAIGNDGSIGRNGDLIWHIPADLKRFKALTTGHPVIMGRKTWDSLPKKPLPNRRNVILTRRKDFVVEGAETVNSVEEALKITEGSSPFIIGGSEIYNAFLPFVNQLFLTEVNTTCTNADAHLHLNLKKGWKKIGESDMQTTPEGLEFQYVTYKRVEA